MGIDKRKKLKEGITTGSCAAAAAAAAIETYLGSPPEKVLIELPGGGKEISIDIEKTIAAIDNENNICSAVVKKNAGDDPDITHGALIGVQLYVMPDTSSHVVIRGGKGVGTVTRPGLPVKEGEPAINPVPRRMIEHEILRRIPEGKGLRVIATVFIEDGETLAENTLNPRLGIIGGLSILGTTGIVKPYSAQSYRETIDICLKSARHEGWKTVALSTGRKSEKLAQRIYPDLDEKCFVQTADFFSYALKKSVETGFSSIILSCFFGKLCKWAMKMEYTHARSGLIDFEYLSVLALKQGCSEEFGIFVKEANNARQIFESGYEEKKSFIDMLGGMAAENARDMSEHRAGITVCLFDYNGELYRKYE